MSVFDLHRVREEAGVRHVEFHNTLPSTNQLAVTLLPDLKRLCPSVVLTETQTAGRGRGANSWWADGGALTFSLVLDPASTGLPSERLPLVSLLTGIAVRRVAAELVPMATVSIKWPNDVLLNGRKVCGILTEQHAVDGQPLLILGIGLNVNNSLHNAPADVQQRATSVYESTGKSVDLTTVLIAIINSLDSALKDAETDLPALLKELNAHSILNGRDVTIHTGDATHTGVCRGIGQSGALFLDTANGPRELFAGTVETW